MHDKLPPFHTVTQGPRLTKYAHPEDAPSGIWGLPEEGVQEQQGHQTSLGGTKQTRIVQGFLSFLFFWGFFLPKLGSDTLHFDHNSMPRTSHMVLSNARGLKT